MRALRVSIVGELGYELYAPMSALPDIHRALIAAGSPHGNANFGTSALNAMRMENGHKGTRELNSTTTLLETGMQRFANLDKSFPGTRRDAGASRDADLRLPERGGQRSAIRTTQMMLRGASNPGFNRACHPSTWTTHDDGAHAGDELDTRIAMRRALN